MAAASAEESPGPRGHLAGRPGQLSVPRRSRAKDPSFRKRAVYVEEACILCKGRKIRCDGKLPCAPCQRRATDCRYTDSRNELQCIINDPSSATSDGPVSKAPNPVGLAELTDIVSQLQRKIAVLEQQRPQVSSEEMTSGPGPGLDHSLDGPEQHIRQPSQAASPVFAGPTSADFSLGMANIILQQEDGANNTRPWAVNVEVAASVRADEEKEAPEDLAPMTASSPLYGFQLQDTLRLIQLYHETVEVFFPVVDVESLQRSAASLFLGECHVGSPVCSDSSLSGAVDVAHLKMAMAIALLAEGGGCHPVARRIHNDLIPVIANHILAQRFTLEGLNLLLLTAFYHIFQDDSRVASRHVVIASRIMIESGLHLQRIRRRHFPSEVEHAKVLIALSTCMYLDRQLGFNAGLPMSLKDTDMDIPEMDTMPPYLKAMTSYMRMGLRAWGAVADERGQLKYSISNEDFEFIDYQVRQWEESLPPELRILRDGTAVGPIYSDTSPDRGTQILQFVLYLRANQFQIVIMRPLLFSTQTFNTHIERVKHMAQLAEDTIGVITLADQRYGLYANQQPIFNLFLSSALSTLLLIYVRSLPGRGMIASRDDHPDMDRTVQHGINKGLELLRSYSHSRSSQRLSKKIASLLQRLGFSLPHEPSDPSSAISHPVSIFAPSPENSLSQDHSGFNWPAFLSDEGLSVGGPLHYPDFSNQASFSPILLSGLHQMPFSDAANTLNNDILLTFMNEFAG